MGPLALTDPENIDGYQLLGRLGAGAMGVVYEAVSATGARVALKTLDLATIAPIDVDDRLERFAREAAALKKVKGESLVRVLAANPTQDQPYLVTALVEGRTLAEHLQNTVMPADQVALLGTVLAEGLTEVHTEGLVHRDIKPANVILGTAGPVLVDFGLVAELDRDVRISRTGAVIGTPLTMAPEQATGEEARPASDVHGLGAVMVAASTGHPPYGSSGGVGVQAMLAKIASPEIAPDLSGVPPVLTELLGQMLAHDPRDRPAAPEVLNRLRRLVLSLEPANLPEHAAMTHARARFARATFVPTLSASVTPPVDSSTGRSRTTLGNLDWLVEELRRDYDRSESLVSARPHTTAHHDAPGGLSA